MPDHEMPEYGEIADQLLLLQLGTDAAELHGSLCGYLSGGAEAPGRALWLGRVMADPDPPQLEPESALDRLYQATEAGIDSPDFGFDLLLPDGESPIAERGEALVGWCRGFLGGFGLAAGAEPPLSEESRDALGDLAKMASSELSYDDPESDEQALEEIAEFVRVAAMLLHSDCVLAPRHRRSFN
ncbi:YecA family protein [soil metagenome]